LTTVIINQFNPKRVDYVRALKDSQDEVVVVTREKHIEGFKDSFQNIVGFENIEGNDSVYSYLLDLNKQNKIEKVVAAHEFDLQKAAYLRDYLKIPGQTGESANAFRDKYEMKKLLKNVVKTPSFKKIANVFDVITFKEENGYPFVVKPVDSAGSVGVEIIKTDEDLHRVLEKGIESNLIAESFVEGDMYHVDGLYADGELLLSQPSIYLNGCLAFQENKYLASVMLEEGNPYYNRLNKATKEVLLHLPTPDHAIAFHAEFFVTPQDEIIFCEIASRVGGGMVPEGIKHTTGIDLLVESIRGQAGLALNNIESNGLLGGFIIIPPKKGKLISINEQLPYEWALDCYTKEENIGREFDGPHSSVDSIVQLVVVGKNEAEIKHRIEMVNEWFEENTVWDFTPDKEEACTS